MLKRLNLACENIQLCSIFLKLRNVTPNKTAFSMRIFTYCLLGVCDLERDRVLDLDRLALLLFLLLLLSFLTLKKQQQKKPPHHYFRYMFSVLEIKHIKESLD